MFGVLIVFLSAAQFSLIQLNYSLNKAYIASELCVEKNVENSKCQGKCHLKKQIEKQKEASSPFEGAPQKPIDITLFYLHQIRLAEHPNTRAQAIENPVIPKVSLAHLSQTTPPPEGA